MEWLNNFTGWQLALMGTGFTWFLTALGASFVFIYKNVNDKAFSFMMSSAAGIMLASTFFSLLMPAMDMVEEFSYLILTCGFVLGGALIIVTDIVIGKLHMFSDSQKKRGCAVMCIAVTMHNIPEGMAVGVAFGALASGQTVEGVAAVMLAVGIGIQNFPEGMCVAFPLRMKGMTPLRSFLFSQGSGAVEIPACVLGAVAATFIMGLMPWALSFSAGAMLAVVCSELIPECFSGNKTVASAGIVLGFCVMTVLDLALG